MEQSQLKEGFSQKLIVKIRGCNLQSKFWWHTKSAMRFLLNLCITTKLLKSKILALINFRVMLDDLEEILLFNSEYYMQSKMAY